MNLEKNWVHYLTRPFGILGASLWAVWYDSIETRELFGVTMPDGLCIEEHPGVVRRYAIKEQLERFTQSVKDIIINDPDRCQEILKKGLQLNEEARLILDKKSLSDLQSAVDFLVRLTLHATIFPYFCYAFLQELKIKNTELLQLAEKLRSVSYYPRIIDEIIIPLARARVGDSVDVMMLSEILAGDTSQVEVRKTARADGKCLVYQRLEGRETIEWVNDPFIIIKKLEKVTLVDSVQGAVAYAGKVQGTARLVLTNNPNVPFDRGDILIAVTTSPTLMPLLIQCSAIVTDEGGVTSHAAIISREIRKPCVIGTKFATHVFKDGDLVEVDATRGIVKIVKKK